MNNMNDRLIRLLNTLFKYYVYDSTMFSNPVLKILRNRNLDNIASGQLLNVFGNEDSILV